MELMLPMNPSGPSDFAEELQAISPAEAERYVETLSGRHAKACRNSRRAAGVAIHALMIEECRTRTSCIVKQPNGGTIVIHARYLAPGMC